VSLPAPVRQRVVALVATVLSDLPPDGLPVPLRRIARFAPQRRAKLGGSVIAAQLESDAGFRQQVANRVVEHVGDLAVAVRDGTTPAAADPVEVAALGYLTRPPGWMRLLDMADEAVRVAVLDEAVAEQVREAERQARDSENLRAAAEAELVRLREQVTGLAAEAGQLRDQARQLTRALRDAEEQQRRTAQLLATEKGRAQRAAADHDAELRRLRARLAESEAALDTARQAGREGRAVDEARLWLLLETISQASQGLRRELALEPVDKLPADFVAATSAEAGNDWHTRTHDPDDPARLDRLLTLPKAHLVIDGYNVTKRGYPGLSLEQQRNRLVGALGGVAAQTGAEVTVVFDGADRIVGLPPPPRGVRVLFSKKQETADDLIRRLVRAEPAGRPVAVVSSDREVADGVRRHGAYPLAADALLRRLSRS
jgi:predicted RNA-binding protein with PIN domain